MARKLAVWVVAFAASPILACGSSNPPGDVGAYDAGGVPATPDGGGARDADAAGAAGGSGGAPPASGGTGGSTEPVVCGGTECTNTSGLQPCCTQADACGAFYPSLGATGCVETNQEGRVDPTCPTLFNEPTGCCRPDGFCGAFYTRAFGCLDVRSLPDMGVELTPCSRYGAPGDAGD